MVIKMNIEDTICKENLPVNSLVMINRLKELLKEHKTNCLDTKSVKEDPRFKKLFWLMLQQFFGQDAVISIDGLWFELCDE